MHAWKFPSMHGKTNCFHGDGTLCECDEMCVHRRSTLLTHKQSRVEVLLLLSRWFFACQKNLHAAQSLAISRSDQENVLSRALSRRCVDVYPKIYLCLLVGRFSWLRSFASLSCVARATCKFPSSSSLCAAFLCLYRKPDNDECECWGGEKPIGWREHFWAKHISPKLPVYVVVGCAVCKMC